MLPVEKASAKKLVVEAPGGTRSAVVVPMPFIDPKKEIPKAT
jgi:hypothetical protein